MSGVTARPPGAVVQQTASGPVLEAGGRQYPFVRPYVKELRYATFGDSTAEPGSVKSTALTDQEVCDVPLGVATTSLSTTSRNGLPLFYPAAKLVAVGGISGQTTTQMIAREGATPSTTRRSVSDVLAKSPDLVILRGGSINDIAGFTTATAQATIDAVYDRHIQILDTLLCAGACVIDEGIQGYDATGGVAPSAPNLSFVRSVIVSLNSRFAEAIATRDQKKVKWLEPAGLTHEGTGAFIAGFTLSTDGTHLTQYGLRKVAQAESALVSDWFGDSAPKSYPGTNLLNTATASLALYPAFTTSGFGNTPTGFSVNATNATRQNGAIVQRDGKRWWTMELIATGVAPSATFLLPYGINTGATYEIPIVAGAQYGHEVDLFFETIDGSALPSGFTYSSRIDIRNASSGRVVYDFDAYTSMQSPVSGDSGISVHLRFAPIQISDSSSALTSASMWRLLVTLVNGGPGIRVGIAAANIVKLT